MRLRILSFLDSPEKVTVLLEADGGAELARYEVHDFDSPLSQHLLASYDWYFSDYPLEAALDASTSTGDRGLGQQLLSSGQRLGDKLLGEDFEFISLHEHILEAGYHTLDVIIQSDIPAFQAIPWEIVIWHEAKFVCAAAVRSFTRVFSAEVPERELAFELDGNQFVQQQIANSLSGTTDVVVRGAPLRALIVLPLERSGSDALSIHNAVQTLSGSIQFDFCRPHDLTALYTQACVGESYHLVHFHGSALMQGASFCIAADHSVPMDPGRLVESGTKVVIVDRLLTLSEDDRPQMAAVASTLLQAGSESVVGLNFDVNQWVARDSIVPIYSALCATGTLGQALVEARKALQRQERFARLSPVGMRLNFQPLIALWGNPNVRFFAEPAAPAEAHEHGYAGTVCGSLFGFQQQFLPPAAQPVADGVVPDLIATLESTQEPLEIRICGVLGSGRTSAATYAAYAFVERNHQRRAYYFDYQYEIYRQDDIAEMIAPILNCEPAGVFDAFDGVDAQPEPSLFVFDNVDAVLEDADIPHLEGVIERLLNAGQKVITTSQENHPTLSSSVVMYQTEPLSSVQSGIAIAKTAMERLEHEREGEHENSPALLGDLTNSDSLKAARQNLFLCARLASLSLLKQTPIPEDLAKLLSAEDAGLPDKYWRWAWSSLTLSEQLMLKLVAEDHGYYLELLSVIGDQANSERDELLSALGVEDISFAKLLSDWRALGFVQRGQAGTTLPRSAATKVEALARNITRSERLQNAYGDLLLCGVTHTMGALQDTNNPVAINLLAHRDKWGEQLERCWAVGSYERFVSSYLKIGRFLTTNQLGKELTEWSADLLIRIPVTVDLDMPDAAKIAWLVVAESTLGAEEGTELSLDADYATWLRWFANNAGPVGSGESLQLYGRAVKFLLTYAQRYGNWEDVVTVARGAFRAFAEEKLWSELRGVAKILTRAYAQLGALDEARAVEEQIFTTIPLEEAPSDFVYSLYVDTLLDRILRKDWDAAEALHQSSAVQDLLQGSAVADSLGAEIARGQGNYIKALEHACSALRTSTNRTGESGAENLLATIRALKEQVGEAPYRRIVEKELADNMAHELLA